MSAINGNQENFRKEVLESQQKVLLDFWAPWCGPCRMVVPLVEQIALENPDIKVVKVNVDEQPELASEYAIMSIPTLIVMEKGEILRRSSGAKLKEAILAMLN